MSDAAVRSSRADLLAAYAATGAKVLAWAVAAAVVYRTMGAAAFAVLALTRGTLGLLNYTAFGLGPAVVHFTSRAATAEPYPGITPAAVLRHAGLVLLATWALGLTLGGLYAGLFDRIHDVPAGVTGISSFVFWFAVGLIARLAADTLGGGSQALGRLAIDQWLAAVGDGAWIVLLVAAVTFNTQPGLLLVGLTYAASGIVALLLRRHMAHTATRATGAETDGEERIDAYFLGRLVAYGGLVTLGSAADFLYAPIDYFILNRLVDPLAPAVYAPAVQIDAAILILTTAIATVALPHAARLHAAGDARGTWRQYVRGSLLAAAVATVVAIPAWLVSPWLFRVWLGEELPATVAILPWVLLHTILGAAAGVGRATLLGMGQAGTYALLVLAGGLVNVAVSLLLVWAGLGLLGVVLGTITSVGLRCVVVMPVVVWGVSQQSAVSSR